MVRTTKKVIRKIGNSYGVLLPKKYVDDLKLWAGCELDVYFTDIAIVMTPDWTIIDTHLLSEQIEVAQRAKRLQLWEKIEREERVKLGNEKFGKFEVARRILAEETNKELDEGKGTPQ